MALVGAGAALHAVGRSTVESADTVVPDSTRVATASRCAVCSSRGCTCSTTMASATGRGPPVPAELSSRHVSPGVSLAMVTYQLATQASAPLQLEDASTLIDAACAVPVPMLSPITHAAMVEAA